MSETSERHDWIATTAGYVAWLTSGLPVLLELAFPESGHVLATLDRSTLVAWALCYGAFGVLLTLANRCGEAPAWRRKRLALLFVGALAALAICRLAPHDFGAVLLVLLAAQAASTLTLVTAVGATAGLSLAFGVLMLGVWRPTNAILAAIAYFCFSLFAIMVEHARQNERAAKDRLARTNAELEATQALLIDGSRGAERLRIARELHDLLGHHLTALSLNLEVAAHLTNGEARPHVEKSQQLTKLLLGDVRAVVSELRDDGCFDLARALRTLTLDLPALRVHLDMPVELCIDDPALAHVLLRGAQEILTNAARHSGARNLWLGLAKTHDGIALTARDDGRGSPAVKPGNG